jgi:small subunit ribosomal protein S6
VIARFHADGKALPEFERALKLDESVIRYLISVHEHELGAPPMTEEQLAARRKADDDDDDEE